VEAGEQAAEWLVVGGFAAVIGKSLMVIGGLLSTFGLVGPPSAAGVALGTDNKSFNMDTQDTQDKVNSNSPVSPILSILYIDV
jgi:hypothetical protein